MATTTITILLTPRKSCEDCRGSGWVHDPVHKCDMSCECALESAPATPEAQEALDAGRFTVR